MSLHPYSGPDAVARMSSRRTSMLFFAKAAPDTIRREVYWLNAKANYRRDRAIAMRPVKLPGASL